MVVWALTKRNLKNFIRNKSNVFFSFLSILVIILLYVFFLGQLQINLLEGYAPNASKVDIQFLTNSWMMAGVILVSTITLPLGFYAVMVADYENKNISDFLCAPLKRSQLVSSYTLAAFIIGGILTFINFVVAELYIVLRGGALLAPIPMIKAILVILLCLLASTTILYFIISFVKKMNVFSILSTVIGTLIGFLAGIFVPIGTLPTIAQTAIKIFPLSYGAVLTRQIFMEEPLRRVFEGVPEQYRIAYEMDYGVTVSFNNTEVAGGVMVLILLGTAAVATVISVIRAKNIKFK